MKNRKKGQFVIVNNEIGVIVRLEFEKETPENHLGIWFGEKDDFNIPIYRTIPEEYCELIKTEIGIH